MDKKILIIIPAFNEETSIENVIENLQNNYPQYDYIIINDGSTDNTALICKQRGFNVINLPINLGIGGAVQTGYKYALENEYDIAIQMDGDGQHNPAYIKELTMPLISGDADIAIGSRFIEKQGFQSSVSRRLGIVFLSRLIQLFCFKRIKDVTSGFRAINRRFIEIYARSYPRDYPEPEAIVAALMHKARIEEIPVIMNARESGTSSINFKRSVYYMIKVSLAIFISRISFGIRREK